MKRGLVILSVFVLVVLIVAIYFTFFFAYSCDDLSCYSSHQKKCSPVKFLNDVEDMTWQYNIKGKDGNLCEVEITVLQIKTGSADKASLEGKAMICLVPLDEDKTPEKDLARCHGELKEELQNLIIQELHKYIIDNVGEISEALDKAI